MNKPTAAFARVRHACGVGVARTGGTEGATQRHIPVECKVCADADYAYMVVLDARVPTRLEGLLPDFLLYTSACLRALRIVVARQSNSLTRVEQAMTCGRQHAASSRPQPCCS